MMHQNVVSNANATKYKHHTILTEHTGLNHIHHAMGHNPDTTHQLRIKRHARSSQRSTIVCNARCLLGMLEQLFSLGQGDTLRHGHCTPEVSGHASCASLIILEPCTMPDSVRAKPAMVTMTSQRCAVV